METKLFIGILWAVGIISTGSYLFIDMATWKANVLFIIAGGFWLVKLIRLCIKTYQEYLLTQLDIRAKKRKEDADIFS